MKLLTISRKVHRWLMLFLGIQFLVWSVSGAYMVIFDIDFIHGDNLVVNHQTTLDAEKVSYPLAKLYQRYPEAKNIEIGVYIDQAVYRFSQQDDKYLLNARNGKQLSPLNADQAVKVAQHYYSGAGKVADIELITDNPPFELSARLLPAWRVNFDDFGNPSIYVSAQTAKIVSKRHQFWRLFDWMFSFHVMDYQDEDPSNQLLFWVTLFSLIASISGGILSYFVIFRRSTQNSINTKLKDAKLGGAK